MNGMAMAKKYAICVILFSFRWKKILHTSNIGISLQLFWMNYSANIKFLESKKDIYDDDGIEKGALSTHYMKFHWILHDATDNYFFIKWSTGRKIAQTHDNLTIQTFIDMCAIGQSANFLLNFMCTHSSVLLFHFFLVRISSDYTIRLLLLHFERRLILFLPHSSLQRGITKNQTWCDVI